MLPEAPLDSTTERPRSATALPRLLLVAATGGLLTGAFAAWAYYDDVFRELSHTFGLWIVLVVLVSARRPWRAAVAASVVALATAVVAFYVGKDVMYGVEYPGMPYLLDTDQIALWLVLAVLAGSVLGWGFSHIGRAELSGTLATAAAVGLLVADTVRRTAWYWVDPVAVAVCLLATATTLAVGVRSRGQLAAVLAWTVPFLAVGFVAVVAPDVLEQVQL